MGVFHHCKGTACRRCHQTDLEQHKTCIYIPHLNTLRAGFQMWGDKTSAKYEAVIITFSLSLQYVFLD